MKTRSVSVIVVVIIIGILLAFNGGLLVKNIHYKNENRRLLLQNDSVISTNLELQDTLVKVAKTKTDSSKLPAE